MARSEETGLFLLRINRVVDPGAGVNDGELFFCVALKAKLTPRACLVNKIRAGVLKHFPGVGAGFLYCCLNCKTGRQVRAYLPGDDKRLHEKPLDER